MRLGILGTAVFVLAAWPSSQALGTACVPGHASLADQAGGVRVFWRAESLALCRGNRRTALTSVDNGTYVNAPPAVDLSADGRLIGYAASVLEAPGSAFVVSVERLRGRDRGVYETTTSFDGVGSLRVTPAGSVAWITCSRIGASEAGDLRCGHSARIVFAHRAADGPDALPVELARGHRIGLRSLRLAGAQLAWMDGGHRRTATLT